MAREIPYIQALGEAVHGEMARDDSVIYFGQNLGLTDDDPFVKAFGKDRVRVTPISETAEIGMAIGAAFAGFRPVVQLYMAEFMLVAMDQVVNEAPRFYGMTGGQVLARVEVPNALPLIFSGFRSATLQVIATATLGAYFGTGGLGRFLIDGQKVRDYPQMAGGALLVAVLALVVDLLLALVQRYAVSPGLTGRMVRGGNTLKNVEIELTTRPEQDRPADVQPGRQ